MADSSTNTDNCTSVTPECPVILTVYGYYPNLAANAFFCAWFAVFFAASVIIMIRYRSWRYTPWLAIGAVSEMIGYIGRLIMHSNPWSNAGFETQICTLIFAPSFFAAAIYITLKHIIRSIGPEFSPLRPTFYPYIFIFADFVSLLLQAIGGGIAASATTDSDAAMGGHIMLAGIVWQVATFTLLYIILIMFVMKIRRNTASLSEDAKLLLHSRDFKIFATGVFIASLAIYVRCVYRIAELEGGWANEIMRNEAEFIVLDGVMCVIAVAGLTVCHPSIWFTPMMYHKRDVAKKSSAGTSREDIEL